MSYFKVDDVYRFWINNECYGYRKGNDKDGIFMLDFGFETIQKSENLSDHHLIDGKEFCMARIHVYCDFIYNNNIVVEIKNMKLDVLSGGTQRDLMTLSCVGIVEKEKYENFKQLILSQLLEFKEKALKISDSKNFVDVNKLVDCLENKHLKIEVGMLNTFLSLGRKKIESCLTKDGFNLSDHSVPEVSWYRDNQAIKLEDSIDVVNNVLIFENRNRQVEKIKNNLKHDFVIEKVNKNKL